MTDNVEKRRGRRGGWIVLAALLAITAWVVRSRRAAAADIGTGWPPPRPAGDASPERPLPGGVGVHAASDVRASGPAASPMAVAAAPTSARPPATAVARPAADPAARRPSPRPRVATPPEPAPSQAEVPPGAAASRPDGSAPGADYVIKGKAASMLFHSPTSPYYARTKAEYWFRTAEDARAAGFTEWTPRKR